MQGIDSNGIDLVTEIVWPRHLLGKGCKIEWNNEKVKKTLITLLAPQANHSPWVAHSGGSLTTFGTKNYDGLEVSIKVHSLAHMAQDCFL